jgi:cytochrome c peroxidase
MHRGQLDTLTDVVRFYSTLDVPAPAAEPVSPMSAIGQPPSAHLHPPGPSGEGVLVPLNLSADQISDLVAFLTALTDVNIDPELVRRPVSPIFRVEAEAAASGQKRGFQPGRPIR